MLTKCMYSYGASYDTAENRFFVNFNNCDI